MSATQQRFQNILQEITVFIQSNEAHQALKVIQTLPSTLRQHPNVKHLEGLALKVQGKLKDSIEVFETLLKEYPNQAEFQNNAANVYKDIGDQRRAIKHYQKALALRPDYFDAYRNVLILYLEQLDYQQAKQTIEQYRAYFGEHPVTQKFIADLALSDKEFQKAADLYQAILNTNPQYTEAKLGFSAALRLVGKTKQAISLLKDILSNEPTASGYYQLGLCLFEQKAYVEAEQAFEQAIALKPLYASAHSQLNEMLWQLNELSKFGLSYQNTLASKPDANVLREDFVKMLMSAEMYSVASEQIDIGLRINPAQDGLLAAKSLLLADSEEYDKAFVLAKQVWESRQAFHDGIELIKLALKQKNYEFASLILKRLRHDYPENQLVLAYQATCLKLTDMDAYTELVILEHSVKAYDLPTPEGYDSLDSFLLELKELLTSMHTTNTRPLQQTLRLGTQTPGRLLARGLPLLDKLKAAYESIVSQYISELPENKQHPFLSRKSDQFKITGSWSVKLEDKGFHVNHVHPEGWISSACYIAIPTNLSETQGCIRFGQSPLNLGEQDSPDVTIVPKAGQLVLFPSYLWHGTLPYESEEMRLTAPFDVIPIQAGDS